MEAVSISACLLNYGNQMLRKKLSKEETSKEIIKLLLENNKTTHIKKQLKLEIIIYIGDFNEVELKIGDNRLYSLNNKLNKFVQISQIRLQLKIPYSDINEKVS